MHFPEGNIHPLGPVVPRGFISIRITWSSPCPLDFIERKWGDSVPQSGLSTGSNILLTGSRSAANMIFVHRRKIPYLGRWVDGQESGEMTDFRMSFWVVSESLLYLERKKKKMIFPISSCGNSNTLSFSSILINSTSSKSLFQLTRWSDPNRAETKPSIMNVLITLLWDMEASV